MEGKRSLSAVAVVGAVVGIIAGLIGVAALLVVIVSNFGFYGGGGPSH